MADSYRCDRLLAIIETQNEIVASGLDLDATLARIAECARALTAADAAVIELAEGREVVRTIVAGTPADDETAPGEDTSLRVPLRAGEEEIGALTVNATPLADEREALELLAAVAVAHLSQRVEGEATEDRRDPVTGLPDRRSYEERLALEAERARRYRYPLALVRFEINGIGAVAEEFGDHAAEAVLCEVADLLSGSRFADEDFRIDDREFAILLPHTDLAGATAAAARLEKQVASNEVAEGRLGATWGVAAEEGHPAALHEGAGESLAAQAGDQDAVHG